MPSKESLRICLADNWILEASTDAGKWLLIGVPAAGSGADFSSFLAITGFYWSRTPAFCVQLTDDRQLAKWRPKANQWQRKAASLRLTHGHERQTLQEKAASTVSNPYPL